MTAVAVTSSMIRRLAHDPARQVLYVEFSAKSGAPSHYLYNGVTSEEVRALAAADSVGKHFIANIRDEHAFQRTDSQTFELWFGRLEARFEINWDKVVDLLCFT